MSFPTETAVEWLAMKLGGSQSPEGSGVVSDIDGEKYLICGSNKSQSPEGSGVVSDSLWARISLVKGESSLNRPKALVSFPTLE